MYPQWFHLMQFQRSKGRTALTIPFFIGALRASRSGNPTLHIARDELYSLLNSFLEDTPTDHSISIYRCADIKQPVAMEFYAQYSLPGAIGLQSQSQKRTTLYVSSDFTSGGACSLTSLTEQLFRELQPVLCAGLFSFRSGVYTPFTDDDRIFVATARRLSSNKCA